MGIPKVKRKEELGQEICHSTIWIWKGKLSAPSVWIQQSCAGRRERPPGRLLLQWGTTEITKHCLQVKLGMQRIIISILIPELTTVRSDPVNHLKQMRTRDILETKSQIKARDLRDYLRLRPADLKMETKNNIFDFMNRKKKIKTNR